MHLSKDNTEHNNLWGRGLSLWTFTLPLITWPLRYSLTWTVGVKYNNQSQVFQPLIITNTNNACICPTTSALDPFHHIFFPKNTAQTRETQLFNVCIWKKLSASFKLIWEHESTEIQRKSCWDGGFLLQTQNGAFPGSKHYYQKPWE